MTWSPLRIFSPSLGVLGVLALGCSSGMSPGTGPMGSGGMSAAGSGGSPGSGGAGGVPASGGGGVGAGGRLAGCPETSAPLRTTGGLVELGTELVVDGAPAVFGEANALPDGSSFTPTEVRFYVSEVSLRRADGTSVNVDIVAADRSPVRYGIALVNAEDAGSLNFRLLAPAGSYTGLSFTLGLNDTCNAGSSARGAPLSAASGMTWPPPFGYLFLRYAGMVTPASTAAAADAGAVMVPRAIHLGGFPGMILAPKVEIAGAIAVTESGSTSMRLQLDLAVLFRGATANIDLSDYPVPSHPEVLNGEAVRRQLPGLDLFHLAPR